MIKSRLFSSGQTVTLASGQDYVLKDDEVYINRVICKKCDLEITLNTNHEDNNQEDVGVGIRKRDGVLAMPSDFWTYKQWEIDGITQSNLADCVNNITTSIKCTVAVGSSSTATLDDLLPELQSINSNTSQANTELSSINSSIATQTTILDSAIQSVETEITNQGNNNVTELQNIQSDLTDLLNSLTSIQTDIQSGNTTSTDVLTKLEEIRSLSDTKLTEINTSIQQVNTSLNTQLDAVNLDLDSIITELQSIEQNTDEIEPKLDDIKSELEGKSINQSIYTLLNGESRTFNAGTINYIDIITLDSDTLADVVLGNSTTTPDFNKFSLSEDIGMDKYERDFRKYDTRTNPQSITITCTATTGKVLVEVGEI